MNANNYDPYAESFEITPEYKMSLFGQSGRMSGVISNTGYDRLIDLYEQVIAQLETGEWESFEQLTLDKENGHLSTPAGQFQLLINFLGWAVQHADTVCEQARSRKEGE